MKENGELQVYCNVSLPAFTGVVDLDNLARYDRYATDQINRLKAAITAVENYRVKLFEHSQKIQQSATHKQICLKREKNYYNNKVFYYVTLSEVFEDFKETYTSTNKKTLEQTKYPGTERHKAIAQYKALKKQYPYAEAVSNIDTK